MRSNKKKLLRRKHHVMCISCMMLCILGMTSPNSATSTSDSTVELESVVSQKPDTVVTDENAVLYDDVYDVGPHVYTPPVVTTPIYYVELSDDEIELFSKLLWFECRGECEQCQLKTASAVVNRMTVDGKTLNEVIYEKNQFEPAEFLADAVIADSELEPLRKIVRKIMKNGPVIPEYITYFREGKYHRWKGMIDYSEHCTTYFSYDIKVYNQVMKERHKDDN